MSFSWCPPNIRYAANGEWHYRPSWSAHTGFLNTEHEGIWAACQDIPGWQAEGDSAKLYEMAYYCGGVILEIGTFGGRSAVVELRGALRAAADHGLPAPQWFGIDVDPGAVDRTFTSLRAAGVDAHCLQYHGDLTKFVREIPIVPSMVFVDGDHRYEGVWADLRLLSTFLAAGTPVFCHDYYQIEGVHRAIDEWVANGTYEFMGAFGCGALLRAGPTCSGRIHGLPAAVFRRVQHGLLARYYSREVPGRVWIPGESTVDLTAPARPAHLTPGHTGRAPWPYAPVAQAPLPPTLPDGKPWPKISIITPSYNYGHFIEQTILSIHNQDYPNIEHIVMDGGSTDNTKQVLEQYSHLFTHWESGPDRGQSHAINKGFAKATGEIVTWVNADDMLAPGALAAVALAFHTHDVDMVAGICQLTWDGQPNGQHLTSCAPGPLPLDDLLDLDNCWNKGQFFYQPEVMFKRSIWEKAGGFVAEDLYYSMDYEMWLRFAQAGARLQVIGRPVAIFRAHEAQKTALPEKFKRELVGVRTAFLERTGHVHAGPTTPAVPKEQLRIVCVNDIGFRYGAGIAHQRLADVFSSAGHHVSAVALAEGHTPERMLSQVILDAIAAEQPDVLFVGNLHGAKAAPTLLAQLAARWPTTVMLHDFWPLTGRCAYPGTCTKYETGCDHHCPTAGEYPSLPADQIAEAHRIKLRVVSNEPTPHLLAASTWAQEHAQRLTKGAVTPARIRCAFPLEVYRPRDRNLCRERLGLPQDRFIIFTSACSVHDERKGVRFLVEALEQLQLPDVLVVFAGYHRPEDLPPLPQVRALGYLNDPELLAYAYSAADMFVGPSRDETFGQVFVEAAACGTPSVAFGVGGVLDAVIDGVTGRLARTVSGTALAYAIDELYRNNEYRQHLGQWARLYVENEYSYARAYHAFYTALRTCGVHQQLGLSRKISFRANYPKTAAPVGLYHTAHDWTPISGFAPFEGPYPEWKLPRFRWLCAPSAEISVRVPKAQVQKLALRFLNHHEGQQLQVLVNGTLVGSQPVTKSIENTDEKMAFFDLPCQAGVNRVEIRTWHWQSLDCDEYRRALMLIDLVLATSNGGRVPANHELAGMV
jgi:glycosyltransferase involved in cell wall biosynthesis